MSTPGLAKLVATAITVAAVGLGTAMTVGAASAHASEKSDCEGKGGTYTQTTITWNGKPGTVHRCCVKDTQTNTTSCTSTTVTNATKVPVRVPTGTITTAENVSPTRPVQRVPFDVTVVDAQIQPGP